jgi:hypothetical protein
MEIPSGGLSLEQVSEGGKVRIFHVEIRVMMGPEFIKGDIWKYEISEKWTYLKILDSRWKMSWRIASRIGTSRNLGIQIS